MRKRKHVINNKKAADLCEGSELQTNQRLKGVIVIERT